MNALPNFRKVYDLDTNNPDLSLTFYLDIKVLLYFQNRNTGHDRQSRCPKYASLFFIRPYQRQRRTPQYTSNLNLSVHHLCLLSSLRCTL
ncbi:hypothetical protein HOLleu_08586 [Holothuria leucospilota]|uniref:Uncharacterized protein n=1 Tax=Holothuria leucospilota TaxID=206669 RepID=A0A9Q1HI01_HOLLE|nr:hypothetical protein HOLleu_08586 [Holothuria leucospilota]